MSSEYDHRPGGSLKLKGDKRKKTSGGIEKRKKKKPKKAAPLQEDPADIITALETAIEDDREVEPTVEVEAASSSEKMTAVERRFWEVQKHRQLERAERVATSTHKDRVHAFNEKLEALSEHHDIPKVGPG